MTFTQRLLAACVALASFASPALAGTDLHVFLWDDGENMDMSQTHKIEDHAPAASATMGIAVSATTVPAGEITFDVLNTSADNVHEMVVSPLDGPDATLPYDADTMRVNEDAVTSPGEVPELDPGASGTLSVTLDPGTYVLYCNVTGHYGAGMWTLITVR